MFQTTKLHRKLTSTSDLARLLGLRPSAQPSQITKSFERMTNFDTSLEIEQVPLTHTASETWEIRLQKSQPRVQVELRQGARGTWHSDIDRVPDRVRRAFQLRPARDGGIETLRTWKSWMRTDWSKAQGRRLRSRQGEILALVEIDGVVRETCECTTSLRIEPVIDECMVNPGAIRIALPCTAGAVLQAVAEMRRACMPTAA